MQEQEEQKLLEQFDNYCVKKHLSLPSLTPPEKKKLIQMIQMLEKLQKGNPQRYEMTLQRMGLDKILDQNSSETSIFDAMIAFYGATKVNNNSSSNHGMTTMKQMKDEKSMSRDIFEDIKSNVWDLINQSLSQNSRVVTTLHPIYGLPIHLLCSTEIDYCPTLEAVTSLVTIFPSGLTTISPSGMYPLHMWLINWRYFEERGSTRLVEGIFQLLLRKDSRVASLQSKLIVGCQFSSLLIQPTATNTKKFEIFSKVSWSGMLPLHIACRNMLPLSVIQELIYAYRKGPSEFDDHGFTALHWTLVSSLRPELITALIRSCPEAVLLSEETFGALPLHLACMSPDIPPEIISSLCDIFPQACKLQDRNGYIPLHYACSSLLPDVVIRTLLNIYPEGSSHSTATSGNILPIHLYLTNGGEDVNVIYLLAKHDLPLVAQDESYPANNGRSWVYLVTAANKTGSDILFTALDWIVRDIYQEIGSKGVYQLAYVLNEQQETLLDTCSVHIQQFFHQYLLLCDRYFILDNEPVYQSPNSLIMTAYDYLASSFYRKCYLFCTQENPEAESDVSSLGESCAPSMGGGGADYKNSSPDFYRADSFQSDLRKGGMTSSEFFDFAQLVGFECCLNGKIDEISMLHLYSKLLESANGNLNEEFMINYCEEYFHHPRKIKLQFSKSSKQTQYEYLLREKELIGCSYIIKLLDTPSIDILTQGLNSYYHPRYDLKIYQSLLTMTNYDYTLDLVYRNEQPNPQQVQRIMKQIAHAILDCHERGVIHGNLTMKNIIRASSSSSYSSFLLSNFYYFEDNKEDVSSIEGAPITGYLPPECFVIHNNSKNSPGNSLRVSVDSSFEKSQHRFSWISEESSSLISPSSSSYYHICRLNKYVGMEEMKLITSEVSPSSGGSLSNHLNFGLDIWAFGLILFAFLTGDHFFPLDRDENLCHSDELIPYFMTLKGEEIELKIKRRVSNLLATNLLLQILQPNQETRITSFHHILSHPYFQSSHTSAANTPQETIQELSSMSSPPEQQQHSKLSPISSINPNPSSGRYNSTKFQPRRYRGVRSFPSDALALVKILTTHNLREQRGGVKGTYHPTSFLIINRKLTFLKSISLEVEVGGELDSSHPKPSTPSGIPDIPPLVTSRVQRWINKLYNYFVLIDHYDTSLTKSSLDLDHEILLALNEICNENELYLYLVDEITLEPILSMEDTTTESMSFPIMITHPSSIIPMILPLMRETYKMICSGKFVENMGHCFGYPLDLIPVHWIDAVEHITGSFESQQREDEVTNWNQYMSKHLRLFSIDHQQHSSIPMPPESECSSLSMSVNYFTTFLDVSDPYQLWCGMTKIYLTEDINCWTKESVPKLLSLSSPTPDNAMNGGEPIIAGADSTNEPPSETCSEESDLKHMNRVLFPPVVSGKISPSKQILLESNSGASTKLPPKPEPIIRSAEHTRTPSPSKKVGFNITKGSPDLFEEEKAVPPDDNADSPSVLSSSLKSAPPLMKGRIYKQPTSVSANRSYNIMKQWTKRYMILLLEEEEYSLKYGVSEASLCSTNGVKGSIQLQIGMVCVKGKKNKSFELILGESCLLRSIAETDEERDQWIKAIQTALQDIEARARKQSS